MVVVIASQDSPAQEPVKPGPEHAVLQEAAGSWEATVKMPDGSEAKGSSKATMECGGLWLISDFRMAFGGAEFQGRGIDGYDADKKKFVSVWVDSMSTAPMLFEGDYDRSSKTLTMTGSGKGPDGKPAKFKSLAVMKEKDRQTFKMFLIGPDGNETLMMTIEYQRKK
jgi:hypothetical protein